MARGILRPGGRHTVVCKHWLRDLCMKGDKCDFLHQYDLARMPECPQWARFGKCPDNDCDFRHDTEKMECQKYKFGFCKLGSQCRMRHDKLSRAYLPETVPDWYLKEIIPNFFDFVPALPEEVVRSTTGQEPQAQAPFVPNLPTQMWDQPPPIAVVGDSAWAAPVAPSWGAPVAPSYPRPGENYSNRTREKVVVDLTAEEKQPTNRPRTERPSSRRNPPIQSDRREPSPPRRGEPERRRERHPTPPRREPERRERHQPSPPRRDRDRGRREEDLRRGGPRQRSRSYERGGRFRR